jgi:predicted P-loop ATPase
MQALSNWVLWRTEPDQNGRPTKVPYQAVAETLRKASSTKTMTWRSFDEAVAILQSEHGEKFSGIGFCFDNSGIVGVDLDAVLGEGGDIPPWVDELIADFKTYCEVSPSHKGIHAYVFGGFTGGGKKKKFKDGTGFELYSHGRFFTVTGNQLAGSPDALNVYDCQALADRFDRGEIGPSEDCVCKLIHNLTLTATNFSATRFDIEGFLARNIHVLSGPKIDRGTTFYIIECYGSHGDYPKDDGRAFIAQLSSGALFYGCLHESCSHWNQAGNHWNALRSLYEPPAGHSYHDSRLEAAEEPAADDWQADLLRGGNNQIRSCIENFAICFSRHPEWQGALCLDEFRNKVMVTDAAPGSIQRGVFDDHCLVDIRRWCERYFLTGDIDKVRSGIDGAARVNRIHPIRQYLHSLTWDGESRVATFFPIYFGTAADDAAASSYLSEVAKMFLVSAVARVFEPGCQVDHLLVLEGPQGIYKSNALRTLFSTEYFTDQMPSLDSKDASLQLSGKWCIEFAEFDRLAKHEAATVKAFVTRRIDVYRKPYAHEPSDIPRQTVFTATVNSSEYLVDEANRRFWPVRCVWVDIEGLARDRDQIWAEAYKLYREKIQWWPPAQLMRALSVEQEQREIENPFVARIGEWLDEDVTRNQIALDERWLTTAQILNDLEVPIAQWKSTDQHVAKAMRKLGYEKARAGKARTRYWKPLTSEN